MKKLDFKMPSTDILNFLTPSKPRESTIGLDFNHARMFATELQKNTGGRYILTRLASEQGNLAESRAAQTTETGNKSVSWGPATLAAVALESLLSKGHFSSTMVNIALSGPVVLTRFIQFPKMTLRELKAAMQYEIEKYIPFEGGDVIADFHILGDDSQDKKTMKVILVAAKKTEISSIIESFRKTHLQIRVIDIHTFACFNAFSHAYPDARKGASVLLDIGSETCSLMVLSGKEPAFIREISLGSLDILEMFKKRGGLQSTPETDSELQNSVSSYSELFAEAVEPLVSQIRLSLNYFAHNNPKAENPQKIYLSGELCALTEFQAELSKVLEIELELWDCLKNIEVSGEVSREELERYRHLLPISIGLALRTE